MDKSTCEVILQPIGKHIRVPVGTTLLDAARLAGVELVAICGGEGVCGTCRVRPVSGPVSPPSLTEQAELSSADLSAGMRLACETEVLGDVRVDIPPESFTTPQRLQVEGQEAPPELNPAVVPLEVEIIPPTLEDLRSDLSRLRGALPDPEIHVGLPVLATLSETLRKNNWRVRLALRGNELVAILPPGEGLYGLAVDVGTTKLAAYLVDLGSGETAAKAGAMNPQIAYGEDVISRIHYSNQHADGSGMLQARLVETLNGLVAELCSQACIHPDQVVEAVIVGNTAMHHLFAGLPVRQLGEAPYVAAVSDALELPAAGLGLRLAPGAVVYLPPNVAGYVGADHVSMLLGADLQETTQTTIALDIGTNTEISLFHAGGHWSCSCASGPAFEGAHISDGMRAAPGAVERVRIDGEAVQVYTIGGQPAVGICGSGILDAVAELVKAGLVDKRGALKGEHPRLVPDDRNNAFVLVLAAQGGTGRDVRVTRQDVNEIQLAKGAIRAGLEILLIEAGIEADAIQQFIVAGAFGTYLDLDSAIAIGMFPELPREHFQQVGNAAGTGARRMLLSKRLRQVATEISQEVQYVELAKHPDFMKVYVKALGL
jgi:uncharacterized 2Fe-2S/4Fe-4S cluster protein (DUF4445 family)